MKQTNNFKKFKKVIINREDYISKTYTKKLLIFFYVIYN